MGSVILMSILAGVVGTTLGALVPVIFKIKSDNVIGCLMGVSAAFMTAVVVFDLIPESVTAIGNWQAVVSLIAGVVLIAILDYIMQYAMRKKALKDGLNKDDKDNKRRFNMMGLVIVFVIGFHNLPEGMAIGSMEVLDRGWKMSLLIALHNLPEGIAMATPLIKSGESKLKAVLLSLSSGIPTVLGAVIGYAVGNVSPQLIGICLALAGGAMMYVVFNEINRGAYELCKNKMLALCEIISFIMGWLLISVLMKG